MVNVVPLAWTSSKSADPWYPLGHPLVVDQVGVLLVEPEVALSWTAPGSVPSAPPAGSPAKSRAPTSPPTSPRASAGWRSPSILGDFSFRNFIGYLSVGFISRSCDLVCPMTSRAGSDETRSRVRLCYWVIMTKVPIGIRESSRKAAAGTRTQPLLTASPNMDGLGQPCTPTVPGPPP